MELFIWGWAIMCVFGTALILWFINRSIKADEENDDDYY